MTYSARDSLKALRPLLSGIPAGASRDLESCAIASTPAEKLCTHLTESPSLHSSQIESSTRTSAGGTMRSASSAPARRNRLGSSPRAATSTSLARAWACFAAGESGTHKTPSRRGLIPPLLAIVPSPRAAARRMPPESPFPAAACPCTAVAKAAPPRSSCHRREQHLSPSARRPSFASSCPDLMAPSFPEPSEQRESAQSLFAKQPQSCASCMHLPNDLGTGNVVQAVAPSTWSVLACSVA
mmetsp:Transcript_1515/g.4627  ORF Transcript_1515/g.4627 Transcript_1515/m.4627 type:complete len:241 (+) Transcript_1515:774-1496(+)